MIVIYGNMECEDCVNCKQNFDRLGIPYEFTDILSGLHTFKRFLRLRDQNDMFEDAKKGGYIGIPALVLEDGKLELNWEEYLRENGFSAEKMPQKTSCGIDGKGC